MSLIQTRTINIDQVILQSITVPVQTVGAQQVLLAAHEIPEASIVTCIGMLIFGHRVGGGAAEGDFALLNVNGNWNRQGSGAPILLPDDGSSTFIGPTVVFAASGKGAGGAGAGTIAGATGTIGLNRNTVEIKVLGVAGTTIDWHIIFPRQVRIMKR
jgi:hypothetical protein